jgi:competence protein ComEA
MRNHLQLTPGWKRLLALSLPVLVGVGALVGAHLYVTAGSPVAVAAGGAGAGGAGGAGAAVPVAPANPSLDVPAPAGLLVDVIGAVAQPGLYRLKRGDRVYDAIASAGGLTTDADPAKLPNLAGRLKDGEQIKVPFAKGAPAGTVIARTNLNFATLDELAVVPGFTETFAQDVIDYRASFGGFQTTRELVTVLGMSEADYVVARRYLTL